MSEPQLQTTTASPKPSSAGSVKDTIESILVAFILAFVFRAFIVEAFVIPTGSMATTLLGAHTRFHCPDCGYDFDVNYQPPRQAGADPEEEPPIKSPADDLTHAIYCPNCGFQMPPEQVKTPPTFYGDRILVLKYLYLLQQPQRFDVVVFKAPTMMTTNYIKRLIGKPGEGIMVIDGDVYIRPAGDANPDNFVIQHKPAAVQNALWRLVYDNDFHPVGSIDRDNVGKWQQPWSVVDGTGWNLTDPATNGRTFSFAGDNTSSRLRFNPQANPSAQSDSEYLVYDQQSDPPQPTRSTTTNGPRNESNINTEIPVSDLDLRLTYQRKSGDGPLKLSLTKRGHVFTAEISPTEATLYQDFDGKHSAIGTPVSIGNSTHPMRIELSNADYQVTLRIDGNIAAQSTPTDFAPDIQALKREFEDRKPIPRGQAEIEAANQNCQISHVSLWRDVYYYNSLNSIRRATPDNPVQLGPDEYFVMGDNSIISWDGRFWDKEVDLPAEKLHAEMGIVPGRFMLGKAFYVYWPAGFQPYSSLPAFIPNFGAMRFIH